MKKRRKKPSAQRRTEKNPLKKRGKNLLTKKGSEKPTDIERKKTKREKRKSY